METIGLRMATAQKNQPVPRGMAISKSDKHTHTPRTCQPRSCTLAPNPTGRGPLPNALANLGPLSEFDCEYVSAKKKTCRRKRVPPDSERSTVDWPHPAERKRTLEEHEGGEHIANIIRSEKIRDNKKKIGAGDDASLEQAAKRTKPDEETEAQAQAEDNTNPMTGEERSLMNAFKFCMDAAVGCGRVANCSQMWAYLRPAFTSETNVSNDVLESLLYEIVKWHGDWSTPPNDRDTKIAKAYSTKRSAVKRVCARSTQTTPVPRQCGDGPVAPPVRSMITLRKAELEGVQVLKGDTALPEAHRASVEPNEFSELIDGWERRAAGGNGRVSVEPNELSELMDGWDNGGTVLPEAHPASDESAPAPAPGASGDADALAPSDDEESESNVLSKLIAAVDSLSQPEWQEFAGTL
jgi:hypothetical protein